MQNFPSIAIMSLAAALGVSALATPAQAAPSASFDAASGWDGGVRFAQPENPHPLPLRLAGEGDWVASEFAAVPVSASLEAPLPAPRKTAAVPVPGSLVLFGSGLVMLAVAGRRRGRRRPA